MSVQKLYRCDCQCSGLVLSSDDEKPYDIWMSVLEYGDITPNWRGQLRHIWRIVTKGTPYGDTVILDQKTALEFRDDLDKLLKNEGK